MNASRRTTVPPRRLARRGLCALFALGLVGLAGEGFAVDAERVPVFNASSLTPAQRKGPVRLRSDQFYPVGNTASNLARARAAVSASAPVHVLVHFDELPDRSSHGPLAQKGVRLLNYLPERTYFACVPPGVTATDLAAAGVRWCGAVRVADKMPARILTEGVGAWARRDDGTADMNVFYFADVAAPTAAQTLQDLGATILGQSELLHRITVNVAQDRLEQLAAADAIRWIEEVPPPPTPFNDGSRLNTQAEAAQAVPFSLSGQGVTLGIWDGGNPDPNHDDFAGRLTLGQASTVDDHATHVAGTMAGSGTLSLSRGGTALQWRGMAPGARIVSYDFNGDTITEHNPAINTFGISLSQNSWGFVVDEFFLNNCSLFGNYSFLAPEYDQIVTGLFGKRISVLFAAGNDRDDGDCGLVNGAPNYINYRCLPPPGTAKNMITVGAINSDDNSITAFSSWGPTDDGRVKPDVVAPGCEAGGEGFIRSTLPGDAYGGPGWCGTSMACPAVSGCAALIIEDYKFNHFGEEPLPSTVKALLIHTAEDLSDASSFYNPGPDYASGYGRIQVLDAVEHARAGGFSVGQVASGGTNSFSLTVPSGAAEVKVTLVWDDPAGAENAAVALVNDLDLVVTDPNGVRHFPWTLDPANPSTPAVRSVADHINVVEQVFVNSGIVPGIWTVSVVGFNVPVSPPQTFSLAFTPAEGAGGVNAVIEETLVDDTDGGDGDGFVDSGETISLGIVLARPAEPTNVLGAISAVLSTVTPGITVTQANSTYPDMPPDSLATNVTPFVFTVASNVLCGSQIEFTLRITTDAGFVTRNFVLDVGNIQHIYSNTFESGLAGITIDNTGNGLWHLSGRRGAAGGHSRTNSLYYGIEEGDQAGTYNLGPPNRGRFTTDPISLLGASGRILLTFNHLLAREPSSPANYDVARVEISANGGASFTTVGGPFSNTGNIFRRETVDLTSYRGHVVQLRFSFDTVDHLANAYEGWYVDDLTIRAFSCGEAGGTTPAAIVAQGLDAAGTNAVLSVHDGISGAPRLSQPVLTAEPHEDHRSFAADVAGNGLDAIVATGVRADGRIDFEVRNGQTGDSIVADALSASLTSPYAATQADVTDTAAAELLFVAHGLIGPTLDVRNGTSGESLRSFPVLDGATCSTLAILPADVNGNGKKDVVVIGQRAADAVLLVDVRDGGSTNRLSVPKLKSLQGPFQALVGDWSGTGSEQIALLTGRRGGNLLTLLDASSGKSRTRSVLKKATGNLVALVGRVLGSSEQQLVVLGSTEESRLAVEVCTGKGKRVRSFQLSTQVTAPLAAVAADVNGDGRDEVIVSASRVSDGRPILIALDANTGGSLYLVNLFESDDVENVHLFTADVDGDGVADVVAHATRISDSRALFEVRAGVSGGLFSAFDQGSDFAGPNAAFGARVGD